MASDIQKAVIVAENAAALGKATVAVLLAAGVISPAEAAIDQAVLSRADALLQFAQNALNAHLPAQAVPLLSQAQSALSSAPIQRLRAFAAIGLPPNMLKRLNAHGPVSCQP